MNGKVFVHRSNWLDWDSPQLLRIQSTVVLLCEHVFERDDVNNIITPYVELLSSSCNTIVTNLQQNIYCRYKAVTSEI